jgi:hypothetical protein
VGSSVHIAVIKSPERNFRHPPSHPPSLKLRRDEKASAAAHSIRAKLLKRTIFGGFQWHLPEL